MKEEWFVLFATSGGLLAVESIFYFVHPKEVEFFPTIVHMV